jgi:magnesium chelatase family protein
MSPPKITFKNVVKNNKTDTEEPFLCDIYGQELAKRALIIAIAGRHNLILSGPPGAGKTLLARAARNLMPDLTKEEVIAITKIHSLTQDITSVITKRPFRSPHHTSSILSLIGGGNHLNPGEISLSHLGILYLDELPEYKRETLEALRQPLEDKKISLARANARYTYPSDFMLLATMNPCPCGYLGDRTHVCKCKPSEIKRYKDKLSGPLLDRIDLRITIKRTDSKELCIKKLTNERERKYNQNVVKNTITEAIRRQHARYKDQTTYNSNLTSSQIVRKINLTNSAKSILNQASEKLNLSARSYFKVIKVAQTIADLEEENCVNDTHILEALSYRMDL